MNNEKTIEGVWIMLSEVVVPKLNSLEENQKSFLRNDHESPCETSRTAHKRIDKLNIVLITGLIILLAGFLGLVFSSIRPVI